MKTNIFSGRLQEEKSVFSHFVLRSPYWGTYCSGQMSN